MRRFNGRPQCDNVGAYRELRLVQKRQMLGRNLLQAIELDLWGACEADAFSVFAELQPHDAVASNHRCRENIGKRRNDKVKRSLHKASLHLFEQMRSFDCFESIRVDLAMKL